MIAVAALAPASAAAATNWATVTGYAPGGPDNNHPGTWGSDCTEIAGEAGATFTLSHDYRLVIVKAGSDQSAPGHANTLFANASAGETVWPDSNGSGAFDEGDKGISHIIGCTGEEETSSPSDSTEPSQSTEPTPSTEPTGSTEPSESTEPSQSTEPTPSTEPSESTEPTESTQPSESVGPTQHTGPSTPPDDTPSDTPSESVGPTQHTGPSDTPSESVGPTQHSGPSSTPSEEVLGIEGTPPAVTPPPTDTLSSSTAPSSDGWRFVLVALAGTLLLTLVIPAPKRNSRKR